MEHALILKIPLFAYSRAPKKYLLEAVWSPNVNKAFNKIFIQGCMSMFSDNRMGKSIATIRKELIKWFIKKEVNSVGRFLSSYCIVRELSHLSLISKIDRVGIRDRNLGDKWKVTHEHCSQSFSEAKKIMYKVYCCTFFALIFTVHIEWTGGNSIWWSM